MQKARRHRTKRLRLLVGVWVQGLSALLGMLNSCSAGVAVVNIDNGFGAGRMASIINHMR